jgi:hypothetical protein
MRVPLLYKAGILRDGTTFQDEYCVDGQWIRFVGGKIKKMKGQRELINSPQHVKYLNVQFTNNTTYLFYATGNTVNRLNLNLNTNTLSNDIELLNNGVNVGLVTWTSVVFIRDLQPCIAFLRTLNANNMLATFPGTLSWKLLNNDNVLVDAPIGDNANLISGGILYSAPCLYLYGNNGTILRSRTNDPLSFDGGDSAIYTISSDKLIFGASVRGGSNAPSFLFWTANSVIYLTNVADGRDVNIPVDFQKEVVTNNSSLMSSRSIVQYDSLFFWLGTDRIFVYNGIVDSIPNTINLEYFFDNVDLGKRQLIFGYKIARYGEVRWAYPEYGNRNNPNIGCTRELVYNVRENSWYDTAIQRDCVTVYEGTGDIFSYGDACTNYPYDPDVYYKKIWRQEVGVAEVRGGGFVYQRTLGGVASSNTGLTNDGGGPPNPQRAFLVPPVINQPYGQVPNTNLMYDYGLGNLQTISRIEITNANVDTKNNYFCNIQSSLDLINWNQIHVSTQNFIGSQTLTFDIPGAQPARAYRLVADPNVANNFLIAFNLQARVNIPVNTIPIPSFFTTPFYGFVTFNPAKNGNAIEKYIVLDQIEPDFPATANYERTEDDTLEITVNYQKYAGTSITRTAPITFNLANLPDEDEPNLGKIDFRVQGRFMNITFSCAYPYDVGTVLMNFKEGDSQ